MAAVDPPYYEAAVLELAQGPPIYDLILEEEAVDAVLHRPTWSGSTV